MKKFLLSIVSMCGLMVSSCSSQHPALPPAEYAEKIKSENVILLDVRTPQEYQSGHLKGALLINYHDDNFMEQVSRLDTNKTVYIYCRSGNRSGDAQADMLAKGFKNVVNLGGGILAWEKEGLPFEK
jgi:phage shock protein E